MQIERKEENSLAMHWLVSRILLSALAFLISEGWEAAERGLAAGSMQKWPSIGSKQIFVYQASRDLKALGTFISFCTFL